jgi:hypothetical protein
VLAYVIEHSVETGVDSRPVPNEIWAWFRILGNQIDTSASGFARIWHLYAQEKFLGYFAKCQSNLTMPSINAREVRLLSAIVVGILALVAVFWVTPKLK